MVKSMKATLQRFFCSLAGIFGALLCIILFAQPAQSLNKETPRRDLNLNIPIDKTGKADIFITFFVESPPVVELQAALGEVTATPSGQTLANGRWLINSLYLEMIAATLAVISQLSFNPQKGGAGLYVLSITFLLSVIQALPVLVRNRKQRLKAGQQGLAYSQSGS
jgi:hypothetical protein